MHQLVRTTTQFQYFTHRVMWEATKRHLDHANDNEVGSYYFYLSTTLLAYSTFEAWVNHVGESLLPDEWKQEKSISNSREFRGTEGKLRYIFNKLNAPLPELSKSPFTAIKELKRIRDSITHPKPYRGIHRAVHPHDKIVPREQFWLEHSITKNKVNHLIKNIEASIERLHSALQTASHGRLYQSRALFGAISVGSITIDDPV